MLQEILFSVIKSVAGPIVVALVAYLWWKWSERRTYGGWQVRVQNGDTILCVRPVGGKKAKEVLDDLSTLSVFLKGVVSPFDFIKVDVVGDHAREIGLFREDRKAREWVINLAHNPPQQVKK